MYLCIRNNYIKVLTLYALQDYFYFSDMDALITFCGNSSNNGLTDSLLCIRKIDSANRGATDTILILLLSFIYGLLTVSVLITFSITLSSIFFIPLELS